MRPLGCLQCLIHAISQSTHLFCSSSVAARGAIGGVVICIQCRQRKAGQESVNSFPCTGGTLETGHSRPMFTLVMITSAKPLPLPAIMSAKRKGTRKPP